MTSSIIYTQTDEAPFWATQSLFPIVQRFCASSDISLELKDLSLAGRILAAFSDFLSQEQQLPDVLSQLAELIRHPQANLVKLPNISASLSQLKTAIAELQSQGYDLPNYPENPTSEAEKLLKERYDKIKGNAVNLVLCEGNSDRRVPYAVKQYAQRHPHTMGEWLNTSQTEVATMSEADFFHNEQSITLSQPDTVSIVLELPNGETILLKDKISLDEGDIVDASLMQKQMLIAFYKEQFAKAKENNLLLSLHLKTTDMKVYDSILFGYALETFFAEVFNKYREEFTFIKVNPRNGLADMFAKIASLPTHLQEAIHTDIALAFAQSPAVAMADSAQGITNWHSPDALIVDASMATMIRGGGKMYNSEGNLQDTLAILPDSSYASVYQEVIDFCKTNGAFSPATMGSVANVGLMAYKAEEYGSLLTTFEVPENGQISVIGERGTVYLSHRVETGDIWRMCITKDIAVQNWVKLAVRRTEASHTPAVFWLDPQRAHDAQLIKKVTHYLSAFNELDLDISLLSPKDAMRLSLETIAKGENILSVTGNMFCDYLTDLFSILELGSNAKVLSIVPLINGGGLFEAGVGGTAPALVTQFLKENHLNWDSTGEYLALGASLAHLGHTTQNTKALVLSQTLEQAVAKVLEKQRIPQTEGAMLDTRGCHFYFALYWAESLAVQTQDEALAREFQHIAKSLKDNEEKILNELTEAQAIPLKVSGYYHPDTSTLQDLMQPSPTFKRILGNK